MNLIEYRDGDATDPPGPGPVAIIHVTNDVGAWGSGFVLALTRRWVEPELAYRRASVYDDLDLGTNQLVHLPCDHPRFVVNMCAQKGVRHNPTQQRAISYDALDLCLSDLYQRIVPLNGIVAVHAPLIGAGLGGGSWPVIESILAQHVTVPTTVWRLR
jgi:O-acetyl-ADP-ribose deacetylase (regulator of RNase III)